LLLFDEGIAERVGDIEIECGRRLLFRFRQGPHFRQEAQLRDRERAELQFEAEQPLRRRPDCGRNGARALILLDVGGDAPERPEQERASANRRISKRHVR
jgi:hypothetical protein